MSVIAVVLVMLLARAVQGAAAMSVIAVVLVMLLARAVYAALRMV